MNDDESKINDCHAINESISIGIKCSIYRLVYLRYLLQNSCRTSWRLKKLLFYLVQYPKHLNVNTILHPALAACQLRIIFYKHIYHAQATHASLSRMQLACCDSGSSMIEWSEQLVAIFWLAPSSMWWKSATVLLGLGWSWCWTMTLLLVISKHIIGCGCKIAICRPGKQNHRSPKTCRRDGFSHKLFPKSSCPPRARKLSAYSFPIHSIVEDLITF